MKSREPADEEGGLSWGPQAGASAPHTRRRNPAEGGGSRSSAASRKAGSGDAPFLPISQPSSSDNTASGGGNTDPREPRHATPRRSTPGTRSSSCSRVKYLGPIWEGVTRDPTDHATPPSWRCRFCSYAGTGGEDALRAHFMNEETNAHRRLYDAVRVRGIPRQRGPVKPCHPHASRIPDYERFISRLLEVAWHSPAPVPRSRKGPWRSASLVRRDPNPPNPYLAQMPGRYMQQGSAEWKAYSAERDPHVLSHPALRGALKSRAGQAEVAAWREQRPAREKLVKMRDIHATYTYTKEPKVAGRRPPGPSVTPGRDAGPRERSVPVTPDAADNIPDAPLPRLLEAPHTPTPTPTSAPRQVPEAGGANGAARLGGSSAVQQEQAAALPLHYPTEEEASEDSALVSSPGVVQRPPEAAEVEESQAQGGPAAVYVEDSPESPDEYEGNSRGDAEGDEDDDGALELEMEDAETLHKQLMRRRERQQQAEAAYELQPQYYHHPFAPAYPPYPHHWLVGCPPGGVPIPAVVHSSVRTSRAEDGGEPGCASCKGHALHGGDTPQSSGRSGRARQKRQSSAARDARGAGGTPQQEAWSSPSAVGGPHHRHPSQEYFVPHEMHAQYAAGYAPGQYAAVPPGYHAPHAAQGAEVAQRLHSIEVALRSHNSSVLQRMDHVELKQRESDRSFRKLVKKVKTIENSNSSRAQSQRSLPEEGSSTGNGPASPPPASD